MSELPDGVIFSIYTSVVVVKMTFIKAVAGQSSKSEVRSILWNITPLGMTLLSNTCVLSSSPLKRLPFLP